MNAVMRESAAECASRLGISKAAAELFHASDVIDLHIDSFIWNRVFGYRLDAPHPIGWNGARFFGQVDIPRLRRVGIHGAQWVITTNPFRSARAQPEVFLSNLGRLKAQLEATEQVVVAKTYTEYLAARGADKHVAFLAVQGATPFVDGNLEALFKDQSDLEPALLHRVTLIHLLSSKLGDTSAPTLSRKALRSSGATLVEQLNQHRILVDLAHISEDGFFRALDVHSRQIPPIVTHTGVAGAHRHWRNLSDTQLRAIADRGGLVGIMYHTPYLQSSWSRGSVAAVVAHLNHAAKVIGVDHLALGSDWDGAITTPKDMSTCLELPRLADRLLSSGWSESAVQKVLGRNYLRILQELRP